jgi:cystathionine gamma-lyase
MRTLVARLERQSRTAADLAAWLERHPAVASALYPGLPSHPDAELARRQMRGYGFLVTFDCRGGLEAARAVAERVRLIAHAPSLGGVESLLSLPVYTSHAYLTAAERAACGVGDGLVRLSVGCEDLGDLQADLEAALGAPR